MSLPSIARLVFFAVNLLAFYVWLLPSLGDAIARKCHESWNCRRYIHRTPFGYGVDLADGQWRELRGSMGLLWACLLACGFVHFGLYYIFKQRGHAPTNHACAIDNSGTPHVIRSNGKEGPLPETYLTLQRLFRLLFALGVLFVQHRYHSLIVLAIAAGAFALTKAFRGTRYCFTVVWGYAILVLLFKESYRLRRYDGYSFLDPFFDSSYGGLYGWQFPANFLVLRLVSFALDCNWASGTQSGLKNDDRTVEPPSSLQVASSSRKGSNDNNSNRTSSSSSNNSNSNSNSNSSSSSAVTPPDESAPPLSNTAPLHLADYSLLNFYTYALYAPLYMAGPIIGFNEFIRSSRDVAHQKHFPCAYALRWGACFLLLEYLTHRFPLFAVVNSGLFIQLSIYEMAAAAYMTLKIMWLKFLLIWRFFRLWALADGIHPPENMLRCMSNNHSLEQFWRGWHASFNRWIIRYLYVPLGGRQTRVWTVWPVFLFVAVWHDIELKLLLWGVLNSVFFVIEIVSKYGWESSLLQSWPKPILWFVGCVGGSVYIILLVGVNLVGYAVGVSGAKEMAARLHTHEGLVTLLVALYFMFVGTDIMWSIEEYRGTKSGGMVGGGEDGNGNGSGNWNGNGNGNGSSIVGSASSGGGGGGSSGSGSGSGSSSGSGSANESKVTPTAAAGRTEKKAGAVEN